MKNIKFKFSVIIVLILLLSSCDDVLNLEPVNSITSEEFYTNASNLRAGLYGVYSAIQHGGIVNYSNLDALSDNMISEISFAPNLRAFAAGEVFTATQGRAVEEIYEDNYILIQRANLLLDNLDGIPAITEVERESIRTEVRALRAYSYMNLTYYFGGVPLVTTFIEREASLSVKRASRNEVIQFVLDEFEVAANVLDIEPFAAGRFTSQAALALRARVMLYEARLGNQSWSDALTSINAAISEADKAGNALIDTDNPAIDYQSLFTGSNENNEEYIFSIKSDPIDNAGVNFRDDVSWQAGTLDLYVHQNLADAYPYADGSTYNPSDDTYIGRDPRLSVNIMHAGITFGGETYDGTDTTGFVGSNAQNTATNLFQYKFVTIDFIGTMNFGELDLPVIRYAELLLMQSEALNETGGNPYPSINAVRDRAGLPALSGLSQQELRDAITLERRLEFAFEGLRWLDLITLGIAESTINNIVEERSDIVRAFTAGRNELLPIPQAELDLNSSLTQNPGY